jgi:hypothetical protein
VNLLSRAVLFFAAAGILAASSCAKDALKGTVQGVERININATFDSLRPEVYYFIVLNFTTTTGVNDTNRPQHVISGTDRGENWDFYIVYHHYGIEGGPAAWETLWRRPGDPRYWMDEIPLQFNQQFFYLSASASSTGIQIALDPLELTAPDNSVPTRFVLDIMTADRGIDRETNSDDRGIVYDWLDDPVIVNIAVNERLNESELLIEQLDDSTNLPPGTDLVTWSVQVS